MVDRWRETTPAGLDDHADALAAAFDSSKQSTRGKLAEFAKYVPRTAIMQFIARYELHKLIASVPGDIVELGVCGGGGLFSFAQCAFAYEPAYDHRRVIGFDTFEGFPGSSIGEEDALGLAPHLKTGGAFSAGGGTEEELRRLAGVHEDFRLLRRDGHRQIELVRGDVAKTVPEYLAKNPGSIVALLYLDMDLYAPTASALELLWDRVPKGGVVVFDEAITREWGGEALAMHEILGIGNLRLRKIEHLKQFYVIKE